MQIGPYDPSPDVFAAWSTIAKGGSVDLDELGEAVTARLEWTEQLAATDEAAASAARGAWLLVEVVERLEASDLTGAGDLLASYTRVLRGLPPAWGMLGADDWEEEP